MPSSDSRCRSSSSATRSTTRCRSTRDSSRPESAPCSTTIDVAGLPGLVLDGRVGGDRAVALEAESEELTGKAVLIRTGWDGRWGTDAYWEPGPFVSPESLDLLLCARPKLVGVDFWNVDDTVGDASRRVHTGLLAAGILVVAHLCNLGSLPSDGFRSYAVPLRLVRGACLPIRVFAEFAD